MDLAKRATDCALSLLLLVVFLPFLFFICILLCLQFKGSFLFCQERIGLHEKPFVLLKFKTMRDLKEGEQGYLSDGARILGIGRWLRKTKWDELPQLLNVLKGEMSLVGPRPLLPEYLPLYHPDVRTKRHLVKPGITGLAQLHGGSGLAWDKRFAFDLQYVQSRSWLGDLKILFKTFLFLFQDKTDNNIGPYLKEQ